MQGKIKEFEEKDINNYLEIHTRKRIAQDVMYNFDTMCEKYAVDHELFIMSIEKAVRQFSEKEEFEEIEKTLKQLQDILPEEIDYNNRSIKVEKLISEIKDIFKNY